MGRLGNQMFQYAFARAYAERHGATLHTPRWIGQELFEGVNESPLPERNHRNALARPCPCDAIPWGEVNIDLHGYFQRQECIDILSRKKLREWFTFKPEVLTKFPTRGESYCAMHLRWGDYLSRFSDVYATISKAAYLKAYDQAYLDEPIIWVGEEQGGSVVGDFLTLARADVLFRANSTFSWWAAVLGKEGQEVYAPVVENKTGGPRDDIRFVEGNWPRFATLPGLTDLHLPE